MNFLKGVGSGLMTVASGVVSTAGAAASSVGGAVGLTSKEEVEPEVEPEPIVKEPESVVPGRSMKEVDHKTRDDESKCGTWYEKPESVFELRAGPNYSRNKLKGPSGTPHCKLVGMDLLRSPRRIVNIGESLKIPDEWKTPEDKRVDGIPSVFIVNVQVAT